jgi:hypothetical protein
MSKLGWGLIIFIVSLMTITITSSLMPPISWAQMSSESETHYPIWIKGKSGGRPDFEEEWLIEKIHVVPMDGLITEINGAIKKSECLGADVPAILTVGDTDLIREFLRSRFGEELWVYCSPKESWQKLGGRMGLVLIHQKQVVAQTTLIMN